MPCDGAHCRAGSELEVYMVRVALARLALQDQLALFQGLMASIKGEI